MLSKSLEPNKQKTLLLANISNNSLHSGDLSADAQKSCLQNPALICTAQRFIFDHSASAPLYNSRARDHQLTIQFPEPVLTASEKLELYAQRIENCPNMGWANVICKDCHHIIKPEAVRFSCLSNYCQDPECLKNRIRVKLARLMSLGTYTKILYHFVIGFKPVEKLSKSHLIKCQAQVFKVIHEVEKTHPKLHLIVVRDINKSKGLLRLHYHVASLPVKDFRLLSNSLLRANKLVSELAGFNSIVQLIGYRGKEGIFDYFSKRASGVFGHELRGTNFSYPGVMDLKAYFETFYNTRTINLYNLSSRRVATEFIRLIDGVPESCPFCGSKSYALSLKDGYDPPDPNLICPECSNATSIRVFHRHPQTIIKQIYDISFFPEDWDCEKGMCKLCAEKYSPAYKNKIFQQEFNKFLDGERGPLIPGEKIELHRSSKQA